MTQALKIKMSYLSVGIISNHKRLMPNPEKGETFVKDLKAKTV